MGKRKTLADRHALKIARKDYKLSKSTDGHQTGRQAILKAIVDGLTSCDFGILKVRVGNTLIFNSNKRLTD